MHDGPGFGIPYDGAPGHLYIQGLPVLAVAAFALAVGSVARHVFALISEVHKGGHIVVYNKDHIAATAAVAAVRTACGHIFFPMKGHGSVSAFAGVDAYPGLIHKRCRHILLLLINLKE